MHEVINTNSELDFLIGFLKVASNADEIYDVDSGETICRDSFEWEILVDLHLFELREHINTLKTNSSFLEELRKGQSSQVRYPIISYCKING